MLERRVARALVDAARTAGLFIRKCRWEGRVGAPDYIIVCDGRVYFVETKAPGEKPRPSQLIEFAAIRAAGAPVVVVDSIHAAFAVVHAIAGDKTHEK